MSCSNRFKAFYHHLELPSRPVARLFYGEVQSNTEMDQMRPQGQVSRGDGRSFGCLRLNCAASLQVGGAHFKRISMSPRACSLGKFLNLTPLKWLDENAFKTSIVW